MPPLPAPKPLVVSQPVIAGPATATTATVDPAAEKKAFEAAVAQKMQEEVMKLQADNLGNFQPITKQTDVTGVPYETIANLKGVQQLDKFDDTSALVLMGSAGSMDLRTIPLP